MTGSRKIPLAVLYGVPVLLALIVKLLVYSPQSTPFNADEAVVALMARHINQGRLMPFFYGQYYMGSLDAILVSLSFKVFGESIWVIRLVQSLLYLGTVATCVGLAVRILGRRSAALIAGLLSAVPPVGVTLYTTVSLGGYGEMLLMGNLLLLGGLSLLERAPHDPERSDWSRTANWFLWSLGAGFAFWVIGLSLVFSLPVIFLWVWQAFQGKAVGSKPFILSILGLFLGFVVGSAPWWASALLGGNISILGELLGGAISGANPGFWLLKPLTRLGSLVVFGGSVATGMRPPWGITWLMLPILPLILIFWLAVFIFGARQALAPENRGQRLLVLVGLVLAAGFIFSPYGDDPSGRYFLPLLTPMAILAAQLITSRSNKSLAIEAALTLLVLAFNLGGTLQSRAVNPPGLTTQFDPAAQVDQSYLGELQGFLEEHNLRTGYTNYWVSYPLAFLSGERIIFIPRLPYHPDLRYTERDDRYPPYGEIVEDSETTAYITTLNPALDDYLRQEFSDLDISWEEVRIGDYTVYYDLSEPVRVSDIGLGVTTKP